MLSRVAESLYWMSRYMERAECIARLVSVNHQMLIDLDLKTSDSVRQNWSPLIVALNIQANFHKTKNKPTVENISEYLVFDPQNPSSICSCFRAARENARAVREQISTEMWEQINRTYLWLWENQPASFFKKISTPFSIKLKNRAFSLTGSAMTPCSIKRDGILLVSASLSSALTLPLVFLTINFTLSESQIHLFNGGCFTQL